MLKPYKNSNLLSKISSGSMLTHVDSCLKQWFLVKKAYPVVPCLQKLKHCLDCGFSSKMYSGSMLTHVDSCLKQWLEKSLSSVSMLAKVDTLSWTVVASYEYPVVSCLQISRCRRNCGLSLTRSSGVMLTKFEPILNSGFSLNMSSGLVLHILKFCLKQRSVTALLLTLKSAHTHVIWPCCWYDI